MRFFPCSVPVVGSPNRWVLRHSRLLVKLSSAMVFRMVMSSISLTPLTILTLSSSLFVLALRPSSVFSRLRRTVSTLGWVLVCWIALTTIVSLPANSAQRWWNFPTIMPVSKLSLVRPSRWPVWSRRSSRLSIVPLVLVSMASPRSALLLSLSMSTKLFTVWGILNDRVLKCNCGELLIGNSSQWIQNEYYFFSIVRWTTSNGIECFMITQATPWIH